MLAPTQKEKQQQKTCQGQKGDRTTKARQDRNRKDTPPIADSENTTKKSGAQLVDIKGSAVGAGLVKGSGLEFMSS